MQREARARLAFALDRGDLGFAHAQQQQAAARGVRELTLALPCEQQELLLRAGPLGHEDLDQRSAFGDAIQRRARVQALDEAGGARLQDDDPALVEADGADGLELRLERSALGHRGAHA